MGQEQAGWGEVIALDSYRTHPIKHPSDSIEEEMGAFFSLIYTEERAEPKKSFRERWNLFKTFVQWKNRFVLQHARLNILSSQGLQLQDQEGLSIPALDAELTKYTQGYVFGVAMAYMADLGYGPFICTDFARKLLHPAERALLRHNLEHCATDPEYEKITGIACIVNRHWLPGENIQRYRKARKCYHRDLNNIPPSSQQLLDSLEKRITENLLYEYITNKYGEEA